jgi:hypothetical protein
MRTYLKVILSAAGVAVLLASPAMAQHFAGPYYGYGYGRYYSGYGYGGYGPYSPDRPTASYGKSRDFQAGGGNK